MKKVIQIASGGIAVVLIFLLSVTYIYYRDLRKTLAARISEKASAALGQRVDIEDLSFSPSAGINLYNIRVRNPEGYMAGDLLRIERIFLKMRYRALPGGKLHFTDIKVYSPALTIRRDDRGKMNISDRLLAFFKKESTVVYQIDDFEMRSGALDFKDLQTKPAENGGEGGLPEEISRVYDIGVRMRNLSSAQGTRTSISGQSMFAGGSKIAFDGSVSLKDKPQKMNISISSEQINLLPLKEFLGRYGVDTERTRMTFRLDAEGDMEKGLRVRSDFGIREAGFRFFKRKAEDISLNVEAFLNIQENSLVLKEVALQAGKNSSLTLSGEIGGLFKKPLYDAELRISRLDLGAFTFLKGPKVSGIVTSDKLRVKGVFGKSLPEITGVIQVKGASLASKDDEIRGIHASLKFLSRGEMTLDADVTAQVLKSAGYSLQKPADFHLLATARGTLRHTVVRSSLEVTPVAMQLRDGKTISLRRVSLSLEGDLKSDALDGRGRVEMNGLILDKYHLDRIVGTFTFGRRGNTFTLASPALEGEGFKSSVGRLTVRLPGKGTRVKRISVEVKGVSASYPAQALGLKNADISAKLDVGGKVLSGDIGFALSGITYRGLSASVVGGTGRFDRKGFSLDVPGADMAGGTVKLAATGSAEGGPFPAKVMLVAENIDIGALSKEALRLAGVPYEIGGRLNKASFAGDLESARSVRGNAEIRVEKIALRKRGNTRDLVNGVTLEGTAVFRGKDAEFRAEATAGKVTTGISGTVEDFPMSDRSVHVRIKVPDTGAADLRNSFWDSFPDSLLYAGLAGSISGDLMIVYRSGDVKVNGELAARELALQGENGEYSVGPVTGVLPIAYTNAGGKGGDVDIPSFERSQFNSLRRGFSEVRTGGGYHLIRIGSLQYGFKFLENVTAMVKQEGSFLNVGHFSGSLFGGALHGTAVIDLSKGFSYRGGMILEGLSMTRLCEEIEPIKGYVSGRVNGTVFFRGAGAGVSRLVGKAEVWTFATDEESMKISREFLKKIGGPSLKAYLGDRRFDRGEMSLYLQKGFVIFKNLEISNRNIFGMKDLSIQVAPLNNRISIEHLMWSVTEAAQRAKEK